MDKEYRKVYLDKVIEWKLLDMVREMMGEDKLHPSLVKILNSLTGEQMRRFMLVMRRCNYQTEGGVKDIYYPPTGQIFSLEKGESIWFPEIELMVSN